MTFGECKMIALQKMSALSVSYLTESRDTRPYLDIMTAPANEGILMIAAVCPVVRSVEIVQTGGTQQGQRRYELAGLAPDFVRLSDDGVYTQRGGVSARCADWQLEAGKVLLLPDREGLWRIYYEARPALFNEQSTDADPVDLPEQAASLLPLYVASQLFKDDDLSQAVQMRNEFELGLSRLAAAGQASSGGCFVSARRWF